MDSMALQLRFLNPWWIFFYPVKMLLKVFSNQFKIVSTYCDTMYNGVFFLIFKPEIFFPYHRFITYSRAVADKYIWICLQKLFFRKRITKTISATKCKQNKISSDPRCSRRIPKIDNKGYLAVFLAPYPWKFAVAV